MSENNQDLSEIELDPKYTLPELIDLRAQVDHLLLSFPWALVQSTIQVRYEANKAVLKYPVSPKKLWMENFRRGLAMAYQDCLQLPAELRNTIQARIELLTKDNPSPTEQPLQTTDDQP